MRSKRSTPARSRRRHPLTVETVGCAPHVKWAFRCLPRERRNFPCAPAWEARQPATVNDSRRTTKVKACGSRRGEQAKRRRAARAGTPTDLVSRRVGEQGCRESGPDRLIAEVVLAWGVGDLSVGQHLGRRHRNDADGASGIALCRVANGCGRRTDLENTPDARGREEVTGKRDGWGRRAARNGRCRRRAPRTEREPRQLPSAFYR